MDRREQLMFGHQDAAAYGVPWKAAADRSDVKDVCGSDPAVYGWDIGKIGKSARNIDGVLFDSMLYWIKRAYKLVRSTLFHGI